MRLLIEPDPHRGILRALVFVLVVLGGLGFWWLQSPHGPAYAVVENDRSETVVIQLASPDDRAWSVPPGGFGPAVEVDPGTKARILTADCHLIIDVTIHAGYQGFVLRQDGSVVEIPFGDISNDAAAHPGCA